MAVENGPNLGQIVDEVQGSAWATPLRRFLRAADGLVQCVVIDKDLTAPPGSPTDGAVYIVGASATGAWATHDGKIARYFDTASGSGWEFYAAKEGWEVYVQDENTRYRFDGGWAPASGGDADTLEGHAAAYFATAAALAGKADTTVTDALDTRLDTAESDIDALQAADTAFDTRLDGDEADIADHESRIATLEAGGGGGGTLELFDDTAKSADYTILSGDKGKTFICTNTIALTLPSVADKFWCAVLNAGTGMVKVGSLVRLLPGEWCRVASDASAFYVIDARLDVPIGHPDRPPVTGTAYDAEFNEDPSGWGWINQNDAAYSVANGFLRVQSRTGTNQVVARAQAVPSGTWRFDAKLLADFLSTSDSWIGLLTSPSPDTGAGVTWGLGKDGTGDIALRSEGLSSYAYSGSQGFGGGSQTDGYFGVEWTGSVLNFYYSSNGRKWYKRANNSPGFTPGKIGIGIRGNQANDAVVCEWIRRVS